LNRARGRRDDTRQFFLGLGLSLLATTAGYAQSTNGQPKFEVASVKPAAPGIPGFSMDGGPAGATFIGWSRTPANRDPGRITWNNIWLERVLQVAYDFPVDRISGPAWLQTERYDIVATVPPSATLESFKLMVQNLLAERFKLVLHRETKQVSGYVLEIARNGSKVMESNPDAKPVVVSANAGPGSSAVASALMGADRNGFPAPRPGNPLYPPGAGFSATVAVNGRYRATAINMKMPKIAEFLAIAAGAPVDDRTGLTGTYDIHLEYAPNLPRAPNSEQATAEASDPGLGLIDAIQLQLGLKLVKAKVPVEMLVVDHVEKVPTEN
jgi:uncharacterized protein (TIGR03435 family)